MARRSFLRNQTAPTDEPVLADPMDPASPEGGAAFTPTDTSPPNEQEMTDDEVIKVVREYRREAFDAKKSRMKKNQLNQMAYMDEQDFSHKQPGQSAEFLPKVSTSAEQFAGFLKRALVQFGDWFSVELNGNLPPFITDNQIKSLLKLYLHNLPDGANSTTKFEVQVSDAAKAALLDSLMIFKIHGKPVTRWTYEVEPGQTLVNLDTFERRQADPELLRKKESSWRLCIDIVRAEDYYPDPTGRGLYEIHTVERDYYEVLAMAEAGIYDKEVVESIKEDFRLKEEEERRPHLRGQDRSEKPSFRRTIVIDECWGTLLDQEGYAAYSNVVCAVANDKYLIRKPEPNPWWHGESPFVVAPLIRVPHSVWHKALYDSASSLNVALNEMFNLMLDGGLASVWGIKQLRSNFLEDPRQVENGVPQGVTLIVSESLPQGEKVLETVSQGSTPQDAMAIFEMLNRAFTEAALTNDIKLGSLPARQVKATEVTEASQSQAVTLDSISADIENKVMEPTLRKAWLTVLQHVEDFSEKEIITTIGPRAAGWLLSTSPAERFAMFANIATFKVNGLSTMLSQVRDFQKTMALMQMVAANPVMLRAFLMNYDEQKVLKQAIKQLNINPDDIARTDDQKAALPQIIQQIMLLSEAMGISNTQSQDGQGGLGGPAANAPGMVEGTAQVNQIANPATGMRT